MPLVQRIGLGWEDYPARKRAAAVSDSLIDWMDGGGARPFFAFVNYFDLHDPYTPPQPWRSRFGRPGELPGGIINSRLRHPDERELTAGELRTEQDGYDGALAYVDDAIGRVLDWIDSHGLRDRTIVVVTSDHGESFGEHGLVEHRNSLYREVIRVPLIIRWPGHVPAGVRVRQPVTNVALAATILEMAGAPDGRFRGPSLSAAWTGAAAAEWPLPLAEIAKQPFEPYRKRPVFDGSLRSVVSPTWQYIEHSARGPQVFAGPEPPGLPDGGAARDEAAAAQTLKAYLATHYPLPAGGGVLQP
jgi:arylsulfatase A-like enzyme